MTKEEREKLSNIIEEDYGNIISPDLENFIEEYYISKEGVEQEDNVALEAIKLLEEKGYRIVKK